MADHSHPIHRRAMLKGSAATSVALAFATDTVSARAATKSGPVRDMLFDSDWRFHLGDAADAHLPQFDDAGWRKLSLPHDWSIEDRPGAPKEAEGWVPPVALWNPGPHPKEAKTVSPEVPIVMASVHPTVSGGPPRKVGPFDVDQTGFGWGMGWTVGGVGWYRKAFALTGLGAHERVEIRFDGAYLITEVWINGVKLGRNTNGYMGFAFDLTPHLDSSGHNILAVRVANEGETARWYSGSGLFRHVWLNRTGDVRVPLYGVATTTLSADAQAARVALGIEVENMGAASGKVDYHVIARDMHGKTVASAAGNMSVDAGKTASIAAELAFTKPALWSPQSPALHTAEIILTSQGVVTDRYFQRFGIRTISVSPKHGLQINGQTHQLQGACLHHDHGILGAVAIDRAERRKVELAKAHGFNAIRCSHNPPTPYFLDVCDEMGMIVMDEAYDAWEEPKLMKQYTDRFFKENWRRDLSNMIRRDRNHASIAFWSIGNEIHEAISPRGVEIATMMRAVIREQDSSRFITQAITASYSGKKGEAARAQLDVTSYNYSFNAVMKDSKDYPDLTFTTTETHSYDAWDIKQRMDQNPAYMGEFLWTGQDYIGEVGSGSSRLRSNTKPPEEEKKIIFGMDVSMLNFYVWDYPAYQSGSGEVDLIGLKKPPSHYRDIVWGRSKLALFVQRPVPEGYHEEQTAWGWPDVLESWNWDEANPQPMTVHVYSSAQEVALLLNGQEVARKTLTDADKMKVTMTVPYKPGALVAVAYADGKEVARKVLETVGEPARLRLRAERKVIKGDASDLGYVFAEVTDAQGRIVPDAAVPLLFEVGGAGALRAAGSANPYGIESFQDNRTRSYHGTALAIVQPAKRRGDAVVCVSSPGLASSSLTIRVGN